MVANVTPKQVWQALRDDPAAMLVDVRTDAEWTYVGLPDLTEAGKQPALIPWQIFPAMAVNGDFAGQLAAAGLAPANKLFFICRSGVRSLAAAAAAEAAGYDQCFNVLDGFEGPPDGDAHRGRVAGWKADGLAWRQR